MVESIITIVLEVVKCLVPPTERQISYLHSYNNNFEKLKKQIEEMKNYSASVQHTVDEAKRNGENIEKNVDKWLASVNKVIIEAEKFEDDEATANNRCFKGLCPNLKVRLQLGKEAVRQMEAISKLLEAGRFDRISYQSVPEDIRLLSSRDYEAFESRMSTLKNILGALKDPSVNMLGIYGMGGIGKTMLVKEVARQVKSDFDEVVFAEVSHSQDTRKIQGEIADKLGLAFSEESESGRASRLCNRLKQEKRILVILDNIWDNIDLQVIGIPHGDDHKGCKVLLTARSEDVLLRKMDSQQNFLVSILEEKEAWRLFKKMAGDYIEGSEFKLVAMEVAKECAGLPVSIVTIAKALRNKRLFEWNDALQQLKRPSSTNFKNIQLTAYSAIELSYNHLESEELKQTFLLIGYAYLKSIDDLLMYGMGLSLFQGVNKMEEAHARVCTLVQKLKASCMLLDEDLSMHDVVRDVALAIASREQNVLTVTNDELVNQWESSHEKTTKLYTSMVLSNVKTNVLPEVLEYPQLKFISISGEKSSSLTIPDNFFSWMTQVRVLALTYMQLLSFPSSFHLLTNLRTLCLYYCKLEDIVVVGNLKKLEILCLQGSEIKQLPEEVGQLTQLRRLDLRYCWQLEVIPPNVLLKLFHLEELYLYIFNKWEVEVEGMKNASLNELKHLHNLTSLELQIKDANNLPRGLFFKKLKKYKICIGDKWYWPRIYLSTKSSRTFKFDLNANICLKDGLIIQLKGVADLWLSGLQDINYFFYEFSLEFSQLKQLIIQRCDAPNRRLSKRQEEPTTDMQSNDIISDDDSLFNEKVVLPNLETLSLHSIYVERIWQSQLTAMSCGIQNLTKFSILECRNLRWIFSSSIVNSFVRLQHLVIGKCPILEEIIVMDQTEMKNVMFPQLRFLEMDDLEKLTSLCKGDLHIEFPSLKQLLISKCPKFTMKYKSLYHDLTKKVFVFPNLEYLTVDAKHLSWVCQFLEDFLYKLEYLDVVLDESTIISSLDFLRRFHTMKIIQIAGEIYTDKAVENGPIVIIRQVNKCCDLKHILKQECDLDNLEMLEISRCDNLINQLPSSTTFQNLTTLYVRGCNGLIKLLPTSTAKSLVRLRKINITLCGAITEIVADDKGDNTAEDEIIFRELRELELHELNSLTNFCSSNCTLKFPFLETLLVQDCHNMKIFTGGELSTPKLHKVQLHWRYKDKWTWKGDLNTTIQHIYLERPPKLGRGQRSHRRGPQRERSRRQRI